jgi:hypothetical protein
LHPILAKPRYFGLYLFVFVQAGLLLGELMLRDGEATRPQVWAVAVPLMLLHAWSCLASWYLCRATRLDDTGLGRLLAVHLAAGTAAALLLLGLGHAWTRLLALHEGLRGAPSLFAAHRALVFGVALLLFSLAVAVHYVLLAMAASRAAEKRAWELRLLAQEAELRVLRAQIDPHFLFNSLNSIASLTAADPRTAREMCLRLADFLRRSLRQGAREAIPLAEELALVESYLAVEMIRFGERLRFERRVDAAAAAVPVPPLLLQPLVENAIRHGIAGLVAPGTVRVEAGLRDGRLRVTVENDCDAESPRPGDGRRGHGIGLANVRRRLAARYGGAATLDIRRGPVTFRVEIILPVS